MIIMLLLIIIIMDEDEDLKSTKSNLQRGSHNSRDGNLPGSHGPNPISFPNFKRSQERIFGLKPCMIEVLILFGTEKHKLDNK